MKTKILLFFLFAISALHAQERLTVFFDFNQHYLNDDATKKLNKWLADTDNIEVTKIYGFCDWKGTNSYNDSLSIRRMKTVAGFLKAANIKILESYETRGFGEDFEQSKIQSENRKVTIVYEINTNSKKIEKPIVLEEEPSLPLQERIKIAKSGEKIRLSQLNFFNMTPRIMPKSKPVVFELLCALQDNPKLKIDIQGHVCCRETDDIGLSLSRAKAVYNFLVSNKINRKRLTYQGFGTTNPIYPIPEKNEFEEAQNRRVEILIVEN